MEIVSGRLLPRSAMTQYIQLTGVCKRQLDSGGAKPGETEIPPRTSPTLLG